MRKLRFPLAAAGVAAVATALTVVMTTGAALTPGSASFTLRAGQSATETGKQVSVPAKPPSADVEIAIDTTGSMATGIADAKSEATAIVSAVQGSVPDTQFATVQFKDAGDSPEYQVLQSMTANASAVASSLTPLGAGGGGDDPEAYNLVFHNSYTPALGGDIGWRSGTRKFVVVIGDAQPHGNLSDQGLGPCVNTSGDPHGLSTSAEFAGMAGAGRTLLMIHETDTGDSTSLGCYQKLASQAFSGGAAVDSGGSGLAGQIVTLIDAAFANVNDVHLEVDGVSPGASASWISLPPALGPVPAPGTYTFGPIGISVPPGTPSGSYSFDLVAKADGVDVGHETIAVDVPVRQLTLTPATDSNPIGTSHTVTAHVFDSLGPFVGDPVTFLVSGGPAASPSGATVATNGSGIATFTFANTPPNPGTNTISATDGVASDTASKTWVNSPPSCSQVVASDTILWPPNHKLHTIVVSGATDSDVGDSASITITGVTQDEPVDGVGDGNTGPDASIVSPTKVEVRAERSGTGDGRVYRIAYTATDTHGLTCSGFVTVGVPHDQGAHDVPIDSAPPGYDSLLP